MEVKPSILGTTWQRLLRWKNTKQVYPRSALLVTLRQAKGKRCHTVLYARGFGNGRGNSTTPVLYFCIYGIKWVHGARQCWMFGLHSCFLCLCQEKCCSPAVKQESSKKTLCYFA